MKSKPVEYINRTAWQLPDGTRHREDGPAIEWESGKKEYYINDKRHRLDGPATVYTDGSSFWWINGWYVDDEIRQWAKEFNIDLNNLTDEDKQMIALYWADYGKV